MVQGLEYTIHRKEKYSLLANKSIAKTDLLVVKKKMWIKRTSLIFYLSKWKKKSSFLEGKYCQWPQLPKLKQPFGLAVQKDKKDKGHFKCFYPSA